MAETTLGAVCMRCEHDTQRNLGVYREFIGEAASRGVQILVFPEISVQGYVRAMHGRRSPEALEQIQYYMATSESVPGPTTEALGELAARHRMFIQVGLAEKALGGSTFYNTAALLGPDGRLVGRFRKIHNQPEQPIFASGQEFSVWDTELGHLGQIICADLQFPETVRILGLKGAEVVLMSTAWPKTIAGTDGEHGAYKYDLLTRAQALMNQVWIVAGNQVGRSSSPGANDYCGHSRIVGPDGHLVEELGEEEGLVVARVDVRGSLIRTRSVDAMAYSRRYPKLYGPLVDLG